MTNEIAIQPQSMPELISMSEVLSKTELVPTSFQGKPNDIVAAVMLGNEIGLKPMQALRSIAVINGRASLWGDAMLALVMGSNVYKNITESFDKESMTATCSAERKDGTSKTQTFSKEDAVLAGMWNKKGPWTQYPARMLQMRARSFCIRDLFPDVLSGFILAEEAIDTPPEGSVKIMEEVPIDIQIDDCKNIDELVKVWSALSQQEKEDNIQIKDNKKMEFTK